MERPQPRRWLLAACVSALVAPAVSSASAQDLSGISQQVIRIEGDSHRLANQRIEHNRFRSPTYVEERLTDGELFYRLRDYIRASIIFTDIVDNFPTHRAYPDALFLLADSLFLAGDQLGARTRFRQILDRAGDQGFTPYVQRALGRTIEIAIRTRDFSGMEVYFDRLSRLPPSEVEAATAYYRAKYLYSRAVPADEVLRESTRSSAQGAEGPVAAPQIDQAGLDAARTAFEAVQERSPFYPQSRYFVGVIYTLRGEFPQAIEAFQRVLRSPASTPEHEQVADLTHLALGRLFYETDQLEQAVEAYQQVARTSAVFDSALYEVAWVFIRQGDATRAERALEVLGIAAPESSFIPDGKMLRGNLLLRNGRYEDAGLIFQEIAVQFGPIRRSLDQMVQRHADPQQFFRDLVRQNMDSFDATTFLPAEAQRWVDNDEDAARAMTVLSDLATCRRLVRETSDLIDRLNALLTSPNRVNAFPELRSHRQATVAIRNQIARTRQQLIAMQAQSSPGGEGGELATIRQRRREIESLIGRMPTSDDDFVVRNDRVLERFRVVEREIRNLEVELAGIDARVVATARFMAESSEAARLSGAEGIRSELENHRQGIAVYREQLNDVRRALERGRTQVGIGDARYQRDDGLRREYQELVSRERRLIASSGSSASLAMEPLFLRLDEAEQALDTKDREINAAVDERTAEIRREIDVEAQNVEGYQTRLAALESETVEVVGGVAYSNFANVRQRFYDLVLRADIGRVDVAWAEREEHRTRVELLTRERTRDIRALDDEFREIMDDSSSSTSSTQGGSQ